ncbi:DUF4132 domain-containing protein [Paenibacillus sp. FSL H7-0331]|uniref:DUF4132 domain-containing protein n=1 Tax=Paenibacillus sp. FSL H7-0331 TaxID=1920421 RepID=UPI00096C616F|nr:DUF4132 domain-containing protein [Paenibacillus sp. FSL H7-0331]OMF09213.1 hypothetical protein BK127_26995 [Paenibacillus sp. FSL H7-0331]
MDREEQQLYFTRLEERVQELELTDTQRQLAVILVKSARSGYNDDESNKQIYALLHTISNGQDSLIYEPLEVIMQLLVDEYQANIFRYIVRHAVEFPYSSGYSRRPFRSAELSVHKDRILLKFISLLHLQSCEFSVIDYLTKPNYLSEHEFWVPLWAIGDTVAYEIDHHNEAVLQALKEIIYGDNNTALLSAPMISGVFLSHSEEAYRMIGELLVAARLQEGLRQSIVEKMDEGTLSAMVYMLKVISEHNLIRYSSVVRALDVWTGLGLEAADNRVAKQCLEYAVLCLGDKLQRDEWLQSSNVIQIYMSLWATAVHEEKELDEKIRYLMQDKETYRKVVAQYVLAQSQNTEVKFDIAHEWLEVQDPELQYWIISNYSYSYGYTWQLQDGENIRKIQVQRNPLLENKTVRRQQFEQLAAMAKAMPQKVIHVTSRVFDWMAVTHTVDSIVKKMMYLTAYDMDEEWIAELIALKDTTSPDLRGDLLKDFTNDPMNPVQREFILASLADKSMSNREIALRQAAKFDLNDNEIEQMSGILKLKTGTLRQSAIQILLKQPAEKLESAVDLLLNSRDELQRLAALEMLTELKAEAAHVGLYTRLKEKTSLIKAPTDKERLLLNKLEQADAYTEANGYGLFDPAISTESLTTVKQVPLSQLAAVKNLFTLSLQQMEQFLQGLSDLIHDHRHYEYEFEDYSNAKQAVLLGTNLSTLKWRYEEDDLTPSIERYPIAQVWKDYWQASGFGTAELIQLEFYRRADELYRYYSGGLRSWEANYYEAPEGWRTEFLEHLYPMEIVKEMIDFYKRIPYADQVKQLVGAYLDDCPKSEKFKVADQVANLIVGAFPEERLKEEKEVKLLDLYTAIWHRWQHAYVYDDASFIAFFRLHYMLYHIHEYEYNHLSIEDFARAYELSVIDDNIVFRELLIRPRSDNHINRITHPNFKIVEKHPSLTVFKEQVLERILEIELNRGDLSTEVTRLANSIRHMEGMDYFIRILSGLDKESFVRGYIYSYGRDVTKKETFSNLLKVCHPQAGEDKVLLKQLLENRKISEQRLLEAAMYAPQWVEIVSDYLGWSGLRSAAWYFHAHINESFSAEKETIVAHYSPISPQDFNDGAFDIRWFQEAYEELGAQKFQILYQCAKYISAGSNHRRSQLFADAVLGSLKLEEMKNSIKDKRNKDHLLTYSLIPLGKNRDRDIRERYEFIHQFLKESKTFGAQRRVSEAKTANIALDNLARNGGYADVIRMTWDMEGRKLDDLLHYLEPKELDDLTAQLVIQDNGKSEIRFTRKGKELKSLPASYKNHEYITALKETKSELTDQYKRAKAELERSMEAGSVFTLNEISLLMRNPVIAPLVSALVLKAGEHLGYFSNHELLGVNGERYTIGDEDQLLIAHPLHFAESGLWSPYQKDLFDRQLKQPFKQIFRELYVPNADELASGTLSRRYAGHQVQPRKTVALLKSRMWTVSYEEGLQKVYYKENVVASIYALADWFSPSDVECPTLETVRFFDRKTYESLNLSQVPPIIFSEVMRDVDLVVSVAHVGGVDPEASLTTIHMRTAIVRESLRLLKIDNVELEGNHARITGKLGEYSVHLGSGIVHKQAAGALAIIPVHSQHRGKLFLPFMDEDPKTAEILSKIVLLAQDTKIKDPQILLQLQA